MNGLEPLLSAKELAHFLDVPIATIYTWRYHGKGPPGFRIGRHLRFRSADVEEWIRDRHSTGSFRISALSDITRPDAVSDDAL